jgi:hypothetical protein
MGGGPAADYTAEFKVQGYGPKLRGRVYGAPGKERRESADALGRFATLIFRYDLGVAWTILATGPYYTEFPLRPPGVPAPVPRRPRARPEPAGRATTSTTCRRPSTPIPAARSG